MDSHEAGPIAEVAQCVEFCIDEMGGGIAACPENAIRRSFEMASGPAAVVCDDQRDKRRRRHSNRGSCGDLIPALTLALAYPHAL
jgi:hypothetical protein